MKSNESHKLLIPYPTSVGKNFEWLNNPHDVISQYSALNCSWNQILNRKQPIYLLCKETLTVFLVASSWSPYLITSDALSIYLHTGSECHSKDSGIESDTADVLVHTVLSWKLAKYWMSKDPHGFKKSTGLKLLSAHIPLCLLSKDTWKEHKLVLHPAHV